MQDMYFMHIRTLREIRKTEQRECSICFAAASIYGLHGMVSESGACDRGPGRPRSGLSRTSPFPVGIGQVARSRRGARRARETAHNRKFDARLGLPTREIHGWHRFSGRPVLRHLGRPVPRHLGCPAPRCLGRVGRPTYPRKPPLPHGARLPATCCATNRPHGRLA